MTKVSKKVRQDILREFREIHERNVTALIADAGLTAEQEKEAKEAFYKTKSWKQYCDAVGRLTVEDASAARAKFAKEAGPTLRKMLSTGAKRLPHAKGGRDKLLSPSEEVQVCREIGKLTGGEGALPVALLDAQKRVARQFGVSVRTVQRAWQARLRRHV